MTHNDGRSFSKRSDPEVGAYGVAPFLNLLAILTKHPEAGEELCMRHHPLEAADQVSYVRGFRGRPKYAFWMLKNSRQQSRYEELLRTLSDLPRCAVGGSLSRRQYLPTRLAPGLKINKSTFRKTSI